VQVEDALRTHTDHLASGILHASSVGALIGLAKGLRSDEVWWPRWIDIYARQPGSDAHDSDIEALTNPDSLIAWTASNVLLTLRVDKQQRRKVEHIAREATDDGARWRAVHVVGSWTDGEALDLCIDRFIKDKSPWVKNGALRSLILVASKLPSEHQREVAFLRLGELSDILLQNPKWTREIERSVRAEHAPPDWPESVGLLLEELWAESDSIADQDRWRRLSASLRTGWRGATELGSTR
jgi:hypothetical protein